MKPQKSRFEIYGLTEKFLRNIALVPGAASAVAVVFDAYSYTMFLSFPFCLIWIYCGWLHIEPQLNGSMPFFLASKDSALCVISGGRNFLWCNPMCRRAD